MTTRRRLIATAALLLPAALPLQSAYAARASDIDRDAGHALEELYAKNPLAADIAKQAKGVLVFPSIVKAGLVFGGSYGEGALREGGKSKAYYSSASAS